MPDKRVKTVNFIELAEAVSLLCGQPGGEAITEELRDYLEAQRALLKNDQHERDWLVLLLQLVLTCPVLLTRPRGFEVVTDELYRALHARKYDPHADRKFWQALDRARAAVAKGRPANKMRDLFRYELIDGMMHPVTTDPDHGLVRVKGRTKTAAVRELADMEARWSGRRPDERDIWRSLKRVEDYLERIKAQVNDAG